MMKQNTYKKRSDRTFEVGDKVYLRVKRSLQQPFTSTLASKLSPKYFGTYTIKAKVGRVAHKLRLPPQVHMHPIFHASLLKKSIEPHATISLEIPTMDGGRGSDSGATDHSGQASDLPGLFAPNTSAS